MDTKQDEGDPRKGCCWRGTRFFDFFKAMISRIIYILHALLIVWRVTVVLGLYFWAFNIILLGIIAEALYVFIKREGKEWTWFQPTILIYLLCTIPCIWLLEMEKMSGVQLKYNSTNVMLGSLMEQSEVSGDSDISIGTISVSGEFWILLLEQSMLVLIIIARWLMPRGSLTHDQLSALLLYYLGTASDIVDFFSVLAEEETLLLNTIFFFTIITFWSWSMLQFIFVSTMTSDVKVDKDDSSADEDDDPNDRWNPQKKKKKRKVWKYIKHQIQTFVESEAWTITVSIFMQDGPFAIVRIICLFHWGIRTYTNYFFTLKNLLLLCLQVYRLIAVYKQHKETREETIRRQRAAKSRWHSVSLKTKSVFGGLMGRNQNKSKVNQISVNTGTKTRVCDKLETYIPEKRIGFVNNNFSGNDNLPNVIK